MKKSIVITMLVIVFLMTACGGSVPATEAPATEAPVTEAPATEAPVISPTATLESCSESDQVIFESINNSSEEISYFWVDSELAEVPYGTAKPGERFNNCTVETHIWVARNSEGVFIMVYNVTADSLQRVDISQEMVDTALQEAAETDAAMSALVENMSADLQMYLSDGRISSAEGDIITLKDYSSENNTLNYNTDGMYSGFTLPANFVYSGHFSWSSAVLTERPSGCGLLFGGQSDNFNHYGIFLDHSLVFFIQSEYDTAAGTSLASMIGKSAGSDKVDFENPAEVDFSLVVNDYHVYVYINDVFVVQYDLAKNSTVDGIFGYSEVSGNTKDYGTRCEITNSVVWTPK